MSDIVFKDGNNQPKYRKVSRGMGTPGDPYVVLDVVELDVDFEGLRVLIRVM